MQKTYIMYIAPYNENIFPAGNYLSKSTIETVVLMSLLLLIFIIRQIQLIFFAVWAVGRIISGWLIGKIIII